MSEINLSDLPKTEIVDVHIASVWSRVAAYLLNYLFNVIIFLPYYYILYTEATAISKQKNIPFTPDLITSVSMRADMAQVGGLSTIVYLIVGIVQLYYMSRYGQSLGKKIMGIRVLKSNGSNPGFLGTVLVRELAWGLIVLVILISAYFVLKVNILICSLLILLINFIMLFSVKRDRRTLYDMLADTVVVKLPPRR
ncbi:RDD family protein [Neisseria subflava]|uniref:RDD family protein n=1 Tax=Neisseria subflava TaxID=28449 RepID=UPI0020B87C01|nr:RDD family protein [Neisseria subflava]UTG74642.1 RDD family protein [Neisseria subflava]